MSKTLRPSAASIKVTTLAGIICLMAPLAKADSWYGTAPFCNGRCPSGESQIEASQCGNGACCWTGHKVLCQNNTAQCISRQTNVSCYGVVEVCSNGAYSNSGAWNSCSTYVCGVCFGFSW
jgi:hypothetical protein